MNLRVFKNAAWIVLCRIIRSVLNLIISMITARYLGPSNFGVISYVTSVVAFAVPIMQLGLRQTLVREFVKAPEREGEILGTALAINILSSFLCMIGSVTFVAFVNAGERETILVCALYSLTLLFQATEMTEYWFQSKLLSKYPSIATVCAYIVVSIYKIWLLVTKKGVAWFAVSNVLEYFLVSVILMVIYSHIGTQPLRFSRKLVGQLLSRSKYYIIPSLMVMIFQHTDRIMLKLMVGQTETGLYSAAIACIGVSGFVFTAVIDSFRPVILEEKERDQTLYEKRVSQLYGMITCMSLAQSMVMTVLAKPVVQLLYGPEYARSAGVLRIAVWYVTFSYYGSVRNIWILAEGKQKYLTWINVAGAAANVLVNLCLIPHWGACGAAVASLLTQFFTNVVIGFLFAPIRRNNQLMLRGLDMRILTDPIRSILHRK